MTVKTAIELVKADNKNAKFNIRHYDYEGKCYTQTIDTVDSFIEGIEDAEVLKFQIGRYYVNDHEIKYVDKDMVYIIFK